MNELEEAYISALEERDRALPFEVSRVRGTTHALEAVEDSFVDELEARDRAQAFPWEVKRVRSGQTSTQDVDVVGDVAVPPQRTMQDRPLPSGQREVVQILDDDAMERAAKANVSTSDRVTPGEVHLADITAGIEEALRANPDIASDQLAAGDSSQVVDSNTDGTDTTSRTRRNR